MKNIYLIGMMGSGKSAVAELCAKKSGLKAVDLDAAIVSDTGRTIPEIFAEHGEQYFRDVESNVLFDLHRLQNLIVATGGGTVLKERNVELMHHSGLIVYLERGVDDIISTIDAEVRPLLAANPENVRRIYEERRETYEKAAMAVVRNDGTIEEAADRVLEAAAEYFGSSAG